MTRASDIKTDTIQVGAAFDGGALLDMSPPAEPPRSLRDRVTALESALEAALNANSRLRNRTAVLELEVFGAAQE